MKTLLSFKIFFLLLVSSSLFAGDNTQNAKRSGFHYGASLGGLWAHKSDASYYDGRPDKQNSLSNIIDNEYYYERIQIALDDDIIKIIAQRVHIQLKEVFDNHRSYVDDVVIDKDDPRVCNIHTCKNSYVALAQPVECPMGPAPIGLLIGGEDCGGLDPAWVNTLGWKSKYGKDVEPLGDY